MVPTTPGNTHPSNLYAVLSHIDTDKIQYFWYPAPPHQLLIISQNATRRQSRPHHTRWGISMDSTFNGNERPRPFRCIASRPHYPSTASARAITLHRQTQTHTPTLTTQPQPELEQFSYPQPIRASYTTHTIFCRPRHTIWYYPLLAMFHHITTPSHWMRRTVLSDDTLQHTR